MTATVVALATAGCRAPTESFEGKPANQVWTALVKAAEQPVYDDWHVIENDVWADERSGRIEIWRLLRRYKDSRGQWARMEDQEWKFAVAFQPEADGHAAEATFTVRSWCLPSRSWQEGDRYFEQVWSLLGGRPVKGGSPTHADEAAAPGSQNSAGEEVAKPERAGESTTKPSEQPAEPPVDLPD